LSHRSEQILGLERQLASMERELASSQQHNSDFERELAEHRQTVGRLQAELAERVAEHRQIGERLQADCDQLRERVDSPHGSICWRITWPIRWLHKLGNRIRRPDLRVRKPDPEGSASGLANGKKGATRVTVLGRFAGSDEAPPWIDLANVKPPDAQPPE